MEALIKMITDKTGISHDQAATAVQTVVGFLKDKMPASLGEQVESFIKGGSTATTGEMADNLRGQMGDKFGKLIS